MNPILRSFRSIALLLAVVLPVPAPAAAPDREIIVGLSPFYPDGQREPVRRAVVTFLLQGAPAGTRVACWDAWRATMITQAEVPRLNYDSVAARAQRLATNLAALKQTFLRGG